MRILYYKRFQGGPGGGLVQLTSRKMRAINATAVGWGWLPHEGITSVGTALMID